MNGARAGDRLLRLRGRELAARPGRPLLMGIVNAGPDSFSDVVRRTTLRAQLEHAHALLEAGADLIDVGAESGVTYSAASDPGVEAARVVPLVAALVADGVVVSVDTWKVEVADAALDAGAHLLNDVSGLRDARLAELAAAAGAGLVLMHTDAEPKQRAFPHYGGRVVDVVVERLRALVEQAVAAGVAREGLLVDPGPDFAKTPGETVAALRGLDRVLAVGPPVLLALSNKHFLGAITGRRPDERLAATLGAVAWGARSGGAMLRVHDVAAAADVLAVLDVLEGREEVADGRAERDDMRWLRADEGDDAPIV